MMAVLNKRWLSQGWRVMDPKDAEPMALIWISHLDREAIPYRYYDELYCRSLELRTNRLAQGLKCDDFSVEMMAACWKGLQAELRQKEIDAGRTLTSNAASVCGDCFGTGFRTVERDGYRYAALCDHGVEILET